MSNIVGRFFVICIALAVCLFVVFRIAIRSPDVQLSLFERAAASRMAKASPSVASLEMISITPCAKAKCALVQAAGRNFLIGAGEGAADSLFAMGNLNAELDGVMLSDLSRDQIEGLLAVRDRTLEAGRREPLRIYGPSGVERVVEGVNAMLETSDADRAIRYAEGLLPFSAAPVETADMGDYEEGAIIFDSGVLMVRAYNVTSGRAGSDALLYRFDHMNQTLLAGGCRAGLEDVRSALEDQPVDDWALLLPLASEKLLSVLRETADTAGLGRESRFVAAPATECLTLDGMAELTAKLQARAIAWPLYPTPTSKLDERLWLGEAKVIAEQSTFFEVGQAGAVVTIDGRAQ